jgi:hypothetical protein
MQDPIHVHLTYNSNKKNTKIWPWKSKISGSLTTFIYPLVISAERVVTKKFLKHLEHTGLTTNIFNESGAKSSTTTNMSYSKQTPRKCPLTLGSGAKFPSPD